MELAKGKGRIPLSLKDMGTAIVVAWSRAGERMHKRTFPIRSFVFFLNSGGALFRVLTFVRQLRLLLVTQANFDLCVPVVADRQFGSARTGGR
jgi:hypothetical protein